MKLGAPTGARGPWWPSGPPATLIRLCLRNFIFAAKCHVFAEEQETLVDVLNTCIWFMIVRLNRTAEELSTDNANLRDQVASTRANVNSEKRRVNA
ncbi:hypothetical protein TNCV_4851441 [Trichonephila clavipes]|nr:hypothetical protein TNCV_4851441 [Trichonephila clavipes]